jgi:hypothetical protein
MLNTLLLSAALPALTAAELLGEGFVRYSVQAKGGPLNLSRRQLAESLENQQTGTSYTIELGIGSPPQSVEVQLDTGSTDLWVNPICSKAGGESSQDFCNSLPRFDYTKSTTYVDLKSSYQLVYGGGEAFVEWSTDDVSVAGVELKTQQFGVAVDSNREPFGILGVGPKTFANQPQYSYFIDSLVEQGFTESRAFGLDLRSIESPDGSIIFGGIDTGKYSGALEKLPIIPESQAPNGNRYWVQLSSITLNNNGASTAVSSAIPVLLDTGGTLMQLPQAAHDALGEAFPTAQLDPDGSGLYIVDCDVATLPGTVDFVFGGKTIKVQYKDVIWVVTPGELCVLGSSGVPASSSAVYILGDSFLRAAYAVFDQDNNNVHLAQAANCGSNPIKIGKGANAVPSVTGDCPAPSEPTTTSSTTTYSTMTFTNSSTKSYPSTTPPYPTSTGKDYPTSTGKGYPTKSTKKPYSYPTLTKTYSSTTCYTTGGALTTETVYATTTYCPKLTDYVPVPYYPPVETQIPTETYPAKELPTETYAPVDYTPKSPPAGYPTPTYPVKPAPVETGSYYPTSTSKPVTAGVGRSVAHVGAGLAAAALAVAFL